jgi:hypothetical protein
MMGLIGKSWRPALLLLFALAVFLSLRFAFFKGSYNPPAEVTVPFERITAPSSGFSTFAEDPPIRRGLLVLDGVHGNVFRMDEISVLLSRVADRGYDVEFIGEPTPTFRSFETLELEQRLHLLDEKLRQADSFVVVLPREPYAKDEVDIVQDFVSKGGKLLLIADPTRPQDINSLAEVFGIAFRPDYLYNTTEYDINFQNIFVRDFRADEITRDLSKIVLYTAGSIDSTGTGLAFTDSATQSSLVVGRTEPFSPLARGSDPSVLAVADLTFMIPPQNSIGDNDRLIANIADFLTQTERVFQLADFPHFFGADVDILLGGDALFDVATRLKSLLGALRIESEIQGFEDLTKDTVFLALYRHAPDVAQYLSPAGVLVSETVRTPFTPELPTEGTALILLNENSQRRVLVILGNTPDALLDMVGRLASGAVRDGLVDPLLGVYRTR